MKFRIFVRSIQKIKLLYQICKSITYVIKKGGTADNIRPFMVSFFCLWRNILREKLEYLLKYISNETLDNILSKKSTYVIDLVIKNRIDVNLNIRYLVKYGIYHIDKVVYDNLEDLTLPHNDFIKKIEELENKTSPNEVIMILENV